MSDPEVIAVATLACALAGLLVPRLIAAVPEPAVPEESQTPETQSPAAEGGKEAEPKEAYADIAGLRGLAWKAALVSGATGAIIAGTLGADWRLLPLLAFVPVGVALGLIDWRTRLLPTHLIAPSYALTLVLLGVVWLIERDTTDLVRALLGWLVLGALFFVLWFVHPRGMGYGDVRLSGVLGLLLGQLGWGELLVGGYAGFVLGGVGGGLLALLRIVERRAFPFGPFMLVGAVLGVLVGEPLLGHLVR